MRPKILDIVLLALALAATVFVSAKVFAGSGGEVSVRISGSEGEWAFPLSRDLEFPVKGPLGTTVVEIKDGRAAVETSPCPNQTCVLAGFVDKPGQWVACLPNHVFVRLEGSTGAERLDGATF